MIILSCVSFICLKKGTGPKDPAPKELRWQRTTRGSTDRNHEAQPEARGPRPEPTPTTKHQRHGLHRTGHHTRRQRKRQRTEPQPENQRPRKPPNRTENEPRDGGTGTNPHREPTDGQQKQELEPRETPQSATLCVLARASGGTRAGGRVELEDNEANRHWRDRPLA